MLLHHCIVADPPWDADSKTGKACTPHTRAVVKSGKWGDPRQGNIVIKPIAYPSMTVAEISALKIPAAEDAHCYIWTINKYIESVYDIARAWGFKPSQMLYWIKTPMGMGLGGSFVGCVEPILFCRRGSLPAKRRIDRNWWQWKRGKHSVKPEAFQDLVESVSPGPYLEMFARRNRPGWSSWGNEVVSDVNIAAA